MKHLFLVLLTLLILPLIGGGCSKSPEESYVEQAIEEQSGGSVDVEIDNDTITFEDNNTDGSMVYGEDIDLPNNFPNDFPVYDGKITINSTMDIPGQGLTLMFTTKDSQEEVLDWYENELVGDSWTESMSYNMQGQMMRSYTKDSMTMNISAAIDDGLTTVTILRLQNP